MDAAQQAIVLFAHGARDVRWREPFERLAAIIQTQDPNLAVRLAFLELMTPNLPDVLQALATQNVIDVTVVPVFFGQGGHIRQDLPLLMAQCQARFPQLKLSCANAVGEDEGVLQAIAQYCLQQHVKEK